MLKPSGIKDKNAILYIEHLEKELSKFKSSPYCASYLNLKVMVDRANKKMEDISNKESSEEDMDSDFKEAMKLSDQIAELVGKMDGIRTKMSPEEKKKVDEHPTGLAEQMALNARKP